MNDPSESGNDRGAQMTESRSPVPAILGSVAIGLVLAIALILAVGSGSSEPTITGAALLAFGIGWAAMAYATQRFSSQPQSWTRVPAMGMGIVGLALLVGQPGRAAMDVLGWVWPPALAALGVWMFMQTRTNLRGRGQWILLPVVAFLLLCSIGGAVTTLVASMGPSARPDAGQLVDVGGRNLYIECQGTGSPVVVLQASLGGAAADWRRVMEDVAPSTTVCAYDRAGHGSSDLAGGPQDGAALAADLHTLLGRAGVPGPYVMVGHSSGGPYVRAFAANYPDEVAGMVLVDAQPADAFTSLPDYPAFYEPYRALMALAPSLSRVGLGMLLLGSPHDPSGVRTANSMRDEVVALPDALQQAQALTTIGDRPLVVVTAGVGQQAGWAAAQDALVALSTNAAHRVIDSATHESLVTGTDSSTSSTAILDVVEAVRSGGPVE
jgi:pimeloyl-ACP methyl ester carboxylesterase